MSKAIVSILTATEVNQLNDCERVIEEGKLHFVAVGEALCEIRDKRLYRSVCKTFEEYCQTKWGWSRQRAHQIIEAADTVKSLPENCQPRVDTEKAARQLKSVSKSDRVAVLDSIPDNEKVTPKNIKEAAKPVHELDRIGRVIPAAILDDWNRAKEVSRMFTNQVSRIKCAVETGLDKETRDVIYSEVGNGLIASLKNSYSDLGLIEPWTLCPVCHGKTRNTCTTCKKRGFVSEFYWTRKTDKKTRAMIEESVRK